MSETCAAEDRFGTEKKLSLQLHEQQHQQQQRHKVQSQSLSLCEQVAVVDRVARHRWSILMKGVKGARWWWPLDEPVRASHRMQSLWGQWNCAIGAHLLETWLRCEVRQSANARCALIRAIEKKETVSLSHTQFWLPLDQQGCPSLYDWSRQHQQQANRSISGMPLWRVFTSITIIIIGNDICAPNDAAHKAH